MRVCTINGCSVAPHHVEKLREIFIGYRKDVEAGEPGCVLLRMHQDDADPTHFVVYAEFVDQAAYDAHLASDHVARLRSTLHELIGDTHHKTILRPIE